MQIWETEHDRLFGKNPQEERILRGYALRPEDLRPKHQEPQPQRRAA